VQRVLKGSVNQKIVGDAQFGEALNEVMIHWLTCFELHPRSAPGGVQGVVAIKKEKVRSDRGPHHRTMRSFAGY